MPRYSLDFLDVASGVSGTDKTLCAIQAPNTAGVRAKIRAINVGPSDATPADKNVSISLNRVSSVLGGGAGTSTPVAGSAMHKYDPGAADSLVSGGVNYTAEPTTYDTEPAFRIDMNARSGLVKEWAFDDAPIVDADMLGGLLGHAKDGTAVLLSGSIEFETF